MPVMFDYECGDCGSRFEHLKMNRDEPDPECPGCSALARKMPPLVAIGTNKGRAVDIAQSEIENMGFSNMKDNLREGDTAAPRLPTPLQGQVDGFWGGRGAASMLGGNPLAAARATRQQAGGDVNPVRGMQEMLKRKGRHDGKPLFIDATK